MDTKLKKSSKLAKVIILFAVLLPALFISLLYPLIIDEVQHTREEYQKIFEEENESSYEMNDTFVNYAVEASYYIYGDILSELGESVDYSVLDYAGWTNDYNYVNEQSRYHAVYTYGDEEELTKEKHNSEVLETDATMAKLSLEFDSSGRVRRVDFDGESTIGYNSVDFHNRINESMEQYQRNVMTYLDNGTYDYDDGFEFDEKQLVPKNFKITFALDEGSDFIYHYEDHVYYSNEMILMEEGVIWLILAAVLVVALVAFFLPFVRPLNTGWGKIFCMPFEFVLICAAAAIGGGAGLFLSIGEISYIEEFPKLEILGLPISAQTQMGGIIAVSVIAWAICFFLEYIVMASVRQFLCGPLYYCKNRLLLIVFLRWIKRKCAAFYKKLTSIEISRKLLNICVLAVLINGFVLVIVCALGSEEVGLGILLAFIYSAVVIFFLIKYGEKILRHYQSIVGAAKEMSEGNLKVELEENLSVFQGLGESLKKVQAGFEKAVVEEAKSQNMKTELITNVSHDLKTPLTAIITYVDLLKKEDITAEERKTYVNTLDQKSQRLKVLIEDLFEVSKATSGNVVMNYMNVDVVRLMKQVKSEMSDQINASSLDFRFNLPEEKIELSLDGQRTYRVFENLINNAIKYSLPFTRVYIDVLNSEKEVNIIFRNVSAKELDFDPERLTERFVRGDSSRNSEGSGLGLAIAKSFVELQKGKFEIAVDGDLFKVILTWKK